MDDIRITLSSDEAEALDQALTTEIEACNDNIDEEGWAAEEVAYRDHLTAIRDLLGFEDALGTRGVFRRRKREEIDLPVVGSTWRNIHDGVMVTVTRVGETPPGHRALHEDRDGPIGIWTSAHPSHHWTPKDWNAFWEPTPDPDYPDGVYVQEGEYGE